MRLTVEQLKEGTFRFSALAETAVVPVRDVEINATFARGAADRLMSSTTRDEQIKFGELLYTYLVPEDFHRMIDSGKPLKLILDRSTASYPWEMACFRSAQNPNRVSSLGVDLRLTRQFRTLLSSAPGMKPVLNRNLKVLIIADPAREPDYQLPGARREGREVASVFRNFPAKQHGIFVEVEEHIGPDQCDPVEILALLLSGAFDIVHYAGHGDYDKDNPAGSGWIFGKDCVLSAREIFRARKVPRLVFANACFSAVTTKGAGAVRRRAVEGARKHRSGVLRARREQLHRQRLAGQRRTGDEARADVLPGPADRKVDLRRTPGGPRGDQRLRRYLGRVPALRQSERRRAQGRQVARLAPARGPAQSTTAPRFTGCWVGGSLRDRHADHASLAQPSARLICVKCYSSVARQTQRCN